MQALTRSSGSPIRSTTGQLADGVGPGVRDGPTDGRTLGEAGADGMRLGADLAGSGTGAGSPAGVSIGSCERRVRVGTTIGTGGARSGVGSGAAPRPEGDGAALALRAGGLPAGGLVRGAACENNPTARTDTAPAATTTPTSARR
jgi:hypothetical protein